MDAEVGVIVAGVVCSVLFVCVVAVICYLFYRCKRYQDEKSSRTPLVNGHVTNGRIPTVTGMVPFSSPSRQLYPFPTMPVRHMTSYRPRYIDERKPDGQRAHTYSGEFVNTPRGPVFYDVRLHGGKRTNRQPIWGPRHQEESEAIMMLGEETSTSENLFSLEENNNDRESVRGETSVREDTSMRRQTSVRSNRDELIEIRRSFKTNDIKLPSPDETRRSYLFTTGAEVPILESTNEDTVDALDRESAKYSKLKPAPEPRRQRRGEEGCVQYFPTSNPDMEDPVMDMYIPDSRPESTTDESGGVIQRYFINDDLYTVSAPNRPGQSERVTDSNGIHVVGHPVGQPEVIGDDLGSRTFSDTDLLDPPVPTPYGDFNGRVPDRDAYHNPYRVIKSKRRPSWFQHPSQWFSKKKSK